MSESLSSSLAVSAPLVMAFTDPDFWSSLAFAAFAAFLALEMADS